MSFFVILEFYCASLASNQTSKCIVLIRPGKSAEHRRADKDGSHTHGRTTGVGCHSLPETIATPLALAQAAGSLPKPAASTTSSIEPASRKSRRPTEETATTDSKMIKEDRVFDGNMKRRGFGRGGRRSNFPSSSRRRLQKIALASLVSASCWGRC